MVQSMSVANIWPNEILCTLVSCCSIPENILNPNGLLTGIYTLFHLEGREGMEGSSSRHHEATYLNLPLCPFHFYYRLERSLGLFPDDSTSSIASSIVTFRVQDRSASASLSAAANTRKLSFRFYPVGTLDSNTYSCTSLESYTNSHSLFSFSMALFALGLPFSIRILK